MKSKSFIGGIDIGGTKTSVAIAEPHESVVARETFSTWSDAPAAEAIKEAVATLSFLANRNGGHLAAIGIGCAGPINFASGTLLIPPNLPPSWHHFPIRSFVEKESGLPVVLENDANAAAVGEHLYGAGRGFTDLVYLTISTGIGGGIIADNRLAHRLGEAGHIAVQPDGDLCPCGVRGCFEAMCAGPAIARRARKYLASGEPSQMREMVSNLEEVTAKTVVDALKMKDELARAVWRETIEFMAIGIGSIMALLAPQAVILGGGVAAGAGELLLQPLREEIKQRLKIIPPALVMQAGLGTDSVLYGALALGSVDAFADNLIPVSATEAG
jgi:glucokinase